MRGTRFQELLSVLLIALLAWPAVAAEVESDAPSKGADSVEVVLDTTLGSFTLSLDPERAPKTVANFLAYVDGGFYDNILFHRVIPGFVVQGGGFEPDLQLKPTRPPVENESRNGLKNTRGTISMARTRDPHSATSQFFINVEDNPRLDPRGQGFGYAVFGEVTRGMEVIDRIVAAPTKSVGRFSDVPAENILILAAKRKGAASPALEGAERFVAGVHYTILDKPVRTRAGDSAKVEVVEAFSYGCPPCYHIEPALTAWRKQRPDNVDFWRFPAVWNEPMRLYARAYYAAQELGVSERVHVPLFKAIVAEQMRLSNVNELADFLSEHGIEKKAFTKAFNSSSVEKQVESAEARVRSYHIAGAPEFIVNGKYRVDRMRAGGLAEMVAVVDFLVEKELRGDAPSGESKRP